MNNHTTSDETDLDAVSLDDDEKKLKRKEAWISRFRFVSSVTHWAALALALFMLIPIGLNAFTGLEFNRVISGSMAPAMNTGDYVVTRPAAGGELVVGKIIGFESGGTKITHRVIKVHDDGSATTQGDANNTADLMKVTEEDLWGVFVNVIDDPVIIFLMDHFTVTPDWRDSVFEAVGTFDFEKMPALIDGVPWGFVIVLAFLIVLWIIEDWIDRMEKRDRRLREIQDDPNNKPVNPFERKFDESKELELM